MPDRHDKTPAQIAYEAYAAYQGWVNPWGRRIPPWEQVRQDIRDAWAVAADAIVEHWEDQHA